ncbi:MAG: hypothetical protein R2809_14035 [Flavobacteriales bacterium]
MNQKHILIINFDFPPNPGIGGRRWAMFAHYLAKDSNNIIHVLCRKNTSGDTSLYFDLVQGKNNIKFHYLPHFYPKVLDSYPKSIWSKIKYRFWNTLLKIYSKGTPYDKALFFKRRIMKMALTIIQKNKIENVIVSGAPFRLCYYMASLKSRIPNLIVDFRDPWTWGPNYGYSSLSSVRTKAEKNMQDLTISNADIILAPVDVMRNELQSQYPKHSSKIKLLPHGFDANQIRQRQKESRISTSTLRLIFIGTLYEGIGDYFREIAKAIKASQDPIYLDIYSDSLKYQEVFEEYKLGKTNVNYHRPVPPKELFEMLGEYDFVLLVHPPYGKDNISTKFYEIAYSGTPILYIGEKGETSNFVTESQLGIYLEPSAVFERLSKFDFNYTHQPTLDVSNYSFEMLTKELSNYFV